MIPVCVWNCLFWSPDLNLDHEPTTWREGQWIVTEKLYCIPSQYDTLYIHYTYIIHYAHIIHIITYIHYAIIIHTLYCNTYPSQYDSIKEMKYDKRKRGARRNRGRGRGDG